jgi:tetratricopeptide (TPR) repeat protein
MKLVALGFAVLLSAGSAVAADEDLDVAFRNFKQAEAQNDAGQLRKLAVATYVLAGKLASAPAPENDSDKQVWTQSIERARVIELNVEYALLAAALRGPAATTVDLLSTLKQLNPKSKYLDQAYGAYLEALRQTGAASIQAVAEQGVSDFPENEDLLLWLAESSYSRKQKATSLDYAKRLVAVLNKRSKPEGISAAAWERKRTAALGRGYCLAGVLLTNAGRYQEADKHLRAALPLVKDNQALRAQVLYFLGVANFQHGATMNNRALVLEAAKFSEEAATIPGPLQRDAARNAYAMKQHAWKMH